MLRQEYEKFNVKPYIGTHSTIVKAQVTEKKFGRKIIFLDSAPIPMREKDIYPGEIFRATGILPLAVNKEGNLYIPIGGKTDLFMQKHNIDHNKIPQLKMGDLVKELEGIEVVCKESDNGLLIMDL